MQLPALMYKSLNYLQMVPDQDTLFKTLRNNPPHLIKFLVKACDDETWAEEHREFMRQALTWVTEEFFQDRLLMEFAQKVAKAIREHYNAMQLYFPLNLTIKLKDKDLEVNSLLYSASSEYMREMIRRECRDAKSHDLLLKDISFDIFSAIHEFISTSSTFDLYRKDKAELIKILKLAMQWELQELAVACQNHIKKYITRENMFDMAIKSHLKHRVVLRNACFDFINNFHLGFRLEDRGEDAFAFEFIDFNENSLDAFGVLKEHITHLICSNRITEEEEFPKVVKKCSKLICLDISRSKSFSDYLKEIPLTLQQLEAAACTWITNETFKSLIEYCPNLTRLVLTSNVNINFEGWGSLSKLEQLRSLDLTRCSQLRDEELRIILQACKELIVLTLEDCRGLTDEAFMDLPKYNPNFTKINLARTGLSDLPLIEIASKCQLLVSLDLTRCENITTIGIIELVKNAVNLKELNLTSCDVPKITLEQIYKIRPFLHIII